MVPIFSDTNFHDFSSLFFQFSSIDSFSVLFDEFNKYKNLLNKYTWIKKSEKNKNKN